MRQNVLADRAPVEPAELYEVDRCGVDGAIAAAFRRNLASGDPVPFTVTFEDGASVGWVPYTWRQECGANHW